MTQTTTITLELATTNTGKQAEMQAFFTAAGLPNIRVVLPATLADVDETETTFLGNATLKATAHAATVAATPNHYIVAEDSGFSIPALAGTYELDPFPGVYSNRWLTPARQHALLGNAAFSTRQAALDAGIYALLTHANLPPQSTLAYYTSAVVVVPAGEVTPCFKAEGQLDLVLVPQGTPQGPHGFGYDGLAKPADANGLPPHHTLKELDTATKNTISHRGKALQQLVGFLTTS